MSEHAPKQSPTQNQSTLSKEENLVHENDTLASSVSFNLNTTTPPLNPRNVLQLQSTIGNAAVQRLLNTTTSSVRRKTVALPHIFSPPASAIQRQPPVQVEEDETETAPRPVPGDGSGPERIVPLSPGEPLGTHEPRSDPALAERQVEQVLGEIIPESLRTGRSSAGLIRVIDATMWERVGVTTYGSAWFDEEHRRLRASAGFTRFTDAHEPEVVYIHEDRGDNAHIMIHESIHVHSNNSNLRSDELVEGITEYYTRRVIRDLGLYATMPIAYPQHTRIVEMLIAFLGADGEQLIANAYFQNQAAELEAAFLRLRGETATVSWTIFTTHMLRNRWAEAQAMLRRP